MKILMINVVCGIRSTGRICAELAAALEAQGHEVKIAFGRENVPEQYQRFAVKIGSDIDVNLHALKARLSDGAGFGSKAATVKFVKWINEYNPDVIHLHNIHGYYINVEVLFNYLKTCGKRVIWTLHDCWSFTGHSAYCDSVNCRRWIKGCFNCPLKKEYPASFFDRSVQNWVKKKEVFTGVENMTIITPSNWLSTLVNDSFLKDYPVEVINNGIDTSQFCPVQGDFRQKHGIEMKFVLLGVATTWNRMKGYNDYLKLSEMLDDDYVVVLVGLTKKQIDKLPDNVLGIEKTSDVRELAGIYTSADLFLNLSYCENYPTVNIEAMSCGTPVLTYKTGGSSEIVEKYGGIVVERGNISAAAKACIDLKERKTVIEQSFNAEENDNSSVIKKYLELYELEMGRVCR